MQRQLAEVQLEVDREEGEEVREEGEEVGVVGTARGNKRMKRVSRNQSDEAVVAKRRRGEVKKEEVEEGEYEEVEDGVVGLASTLLREEEVEEEVQVEAQVEAGRKELEEVKRKYDDLVKKLRDKVHCRSTPAPPAPPEPHVLPAPTAPPAPPAPPAPLSPPAPPAPGAKL